MHHLVFDGWSKQVLVRELGGTYSALRRGSEPELTVPEVQYGDWAAWQRSCVAGGHYANGIAFWRRRLEGSAATELPGDLPRPRDASGAGARLLFALPKVKTDRLRDIAAREGATLFMLLLAAYALVLEQRSGPDGVLIGTPVAGRQDRRLAPLIGLFMNMLPLPVELPPRGEFRDALAAARDACLHAFSNDVPLAVIEDALGRRPLFRILFALQTVKPGASALPDLDVTPFTVAAGPSSRRDISFFLNDTAGGLHGTLEFSTELFTHRTMEGQLGRFADILTAVLADPGIRLEALRR